MKRMVIIAVLLFAGDATAATWCNEFKIGYLRAYCLRNTASCLPPPVVCPAYNFDVDPYMLGVRYGLRDRKRDLL